MLLLFVLASLIPLATLAVLTFYQVRSDLIDELGSSLRAEAKTAAMDFHLRLELAQEQIDHTANRLSTEGIGDLDQLGIQSSRRFDAIWLVNKENSQILMGDESVQPPELEFDAQPRLRIQKNGPYSADILIISSFYIDGSPAQLIVALNNEALWENVGSTSELLCISTPNKINLFCSEQVRETWLDETAERFTNEDSDFFLSSDKIYSAYWSIFESDYKDSPQFIAIAGTSESIAMAGIEQFESIFIRVVVLTLLLIALVSMRAIRASLDPLEKLLKATRTVSEGEFSSRVDLHTGDEFEELGSSFNTMVDRIGRQFDLQSTMSNLGQQLQGATGTEETIELIFTAINKIIDSPMLMVTYVVKEGTSTASFKYVSSANHRTQHQVMDLIEKPRLTSEVKLISGEDLISKHVGSEAEFDAKKQYCVVPGFKDDEIIAVLVIDACNLPRISDSVDLFLKQIGVLLASSLSNVFLSDRLYYQAHHDHLTGLPNRLYLKNVIEKEMQESNDHSLIVSIFDIDRFKLINDTQGHAAGDELLIQIGERLRENLDDSALASRFAGDEFIILTKHETTEVAESDAIKKVADPIKKVFSKPFYIGNSKLKVDASLGLARYPRDGDNFVTLLMNADAAMYHAKKTNPGGHCFYSQELQEKLAKRLDVEVALNTALPGNELELYYQPIIELKNREVSGAEALMRWNRPGHGVVMPDEFIPVAEETGQIIGLGDWAMLEACQAFKRMLNEGLELNTMAVNVSGYQLSEPDFVQKLQNVLEVSALPSKYLEIEITETCLVDNIEATITKLDEIRGLGVRVSVDDFGTGYSSLQYLKRLPVDKLKIDQMFVRDLPHDESDIAIVKTLVSLARELNLTVLAEGCQTEAQAQFLEKESVLKVQGWLFAKAMQEQDFMDYVRTQNADLGNVSDLSS